MQTQNESDDSFDLDAEEFFHAEDEICLEKTNAADKRASEKFFKISEELDDLKKLKRQSSEKGDVNLAALETKRSDLVSKIARE